VDLVGGQGVFEQEGKGGWIKKQGSMEVSFFYVLEPKSNCSPLQWERDHNRGTGQSINMN